jgi:hypothetical protein
MSTSQNQLSALENLRADAEAIAAKLASELQRHKEKMAELKSADSARKFSPEYQRFQVQNERSRARQIAKMEEADFRALKAKLESAAQAWATETLMRRARAVPESGKVEHDILNELKMMRLEREFSVAKPDELIAFAADAKESGDLASLRLLSKEVGRRQFDGIERARVRVALDEAISGVRVPNQAEAHSILQSALEKVSDAWDSLAELESGKESLHAEMMRVTRKHFPQSGESEPESGESEPESGEPESGESGESAA